MHCLRRRGRLHGERILESASDDGAGPIRKEREDGLIRNNCLIVGATLMGWVLRDEERAADARKEDSRDHS